jgi:CMP-N,N'-diacetyllegionaminic acid synthase
MAKVIALIPARSGSKGVPNKNILKLGGHPLIAWSIQACKKSKYINEIYVSTDSKEYAEIAESYGAKIPFLRPANLAGDNSTDLDVIRHFIEWFRSKGEIIDLIVHIRPTTPFRDPLIIDDAINFFNKNHDSITSLRSIHEMSETAYKSFEIDSAGVLIQAFSHNKNLDNSNNSRQMYPKTFSANGYVDILKVNYIIKNNLIHGDKVFAYKTEPIIEIDTIFDFNLLEFQLTKQPNLIDIFKYGQS